MKKWGLTLLATLSAFSTSSLRANGQEQTMVVQPGPDGKDAYICTCKPSTPSPAGDPTHLWQGYLDQPPAFNQCFEGFLIQWSFPKLPNEATILSAKMELYCDYFYGTKSGKAVFRLVTGPWDEATVAWANKPEVQSDSEITADWPSGQTWLSLDVTEFVRGWHEGTFPNHGIFALSTGTGQSTSSAAFLSSDSGNARQRPKLTITYTLQPPDVVIGRTGDGGISLGWSDSGLNFCYTVELRDAMTGQSWSPAPPVEQWPTRVTSWTDRPPPDILKRCYRIKARRLISPPSPPAESKAKGASVAKKIGQAIERALSLYEPPGGSPETLPTASQARCACCPCETRHCAATPCADSSAICSDARRNEGLVSDGPPHP